MPYYDLNVLHPADPATLRSLHELGYDTVAINYEFAGKFTPTQVIENPIDLDTLQSCVPGMTVLSRVTISLEDKSMNYNLANAASRFDILAIRPTSEKTLQYACGQMDIDLVSLDFTTRLPFLLKFAMAGTAYGRGVGLEISYAAAMADDTAGRRCLFSNASSLVRASRGKGILISSGAASQNLLRSPHDMINLATFWGLPQNRAAQAVGDNARKLIVKAMTRRTVHKGVVRITQAPAFTPQKRQAQDAVAAPADKLTKKQRKALKQQQQHVRS
ncbi:RNA-binding RNA processing protein rpp1 [Savitreella phatthalungensis]